jgi:short-subunit dehydrogenase
MQTPSPRCAVITGAASGIGRALAIALAARGASLVLADIDSAALHATARHLGKTAPAIRVLPIVADLGQPGQVAGLAGSAFEAFGRVDWLFNCAGLLASGRSWEFDEQQWARLMDVNFWSVVRATRAFVPRMLQQGHGHIVNIASLAGMLPAPFLAPYTVSKHALVSYSETLQQEFQALGMPLHVSVALPGPVDTGISRNIGAPTGDAAVDGLNSYLRGMIAEGMAPADLADTVLAGVDHQQFWIFPHAEMLKSALGQRHAMLQAVN